MKDGYVCFSSLFWQEIPLHIKSSFDVIQKFRGYFQDGFLCLLRDGCFLLQILEVFYLLINKKVMKGL